MSYPFQIMETEQNLSSRSYLKFLNYILMHDYINIT